MVIVFTGLITVSLSNKYDGRCVWKICSRPLKNRMRESLQPKLTTTFLPRIEKIDTEVLKTLIKILKDRNTIRLK